MSLELGVNHLLAFVKIPRKFQVFRDDTLASSFYIFLQEVCNKTVYIGFLVLYPQGVTTVSKSGIGHVTSQQCSGRK